MIFVNNYNPEEDADLDDFEDDEERKEEEKERERKKKKNLATSNKILDILNEPDFQEEFSLKQKILGQQDELRNLAEKMDKEKNEELKEEIRKDFEETMNEYKKEVLGENSGLGGKDWLNIAKMAADTGVELTKTILGHNLKKSRMNRQN